MRTFHSIAVLCSLCFLALSGATAKALAEDWNQYRGPNGDGKSSESIGEVDWADGADVVWRSETPLGFSSFSVANDRAFTLIAKEDAKGNLREVCLALDANTGEKLWEVALAEAEYGHDGGNAGAPDNRGGDGPRSTPTTDGKRVYVYDAHLNLVCLDAESGNEVWKHDIQAEFGGRNIKWLNATSPVLDGDKLYITGGGANQSFLAFDKNSGANIWKSGDSEMTHATPSLGQLASREQLVFFTQSGLVGVDPKSGQQLWDTDFDFRVSTAASPILDGSLVYCSAGYSVGAGLFEVSKDNQVEQRWLQTNKLQNHWSTPVVHDGHLYGIYEFKKYGRAPLQCVELATGEIKWSERNFGPGNCILVGDKLVVLSDAGEVVLASATPDAYREIARTKAVEGKCWSTPAFSDGRIYVRSTQEAVCISVN